MERNKKEQIIICCPECKIIDVVEGEQTSDGLFINHTCKKCNHTLTESEWEDALYKSEEPKVKNIKDAVKTLKAYNKWRRDNSIPNKYKMPNPKDIGLAIDITIEFITKKIK